MVINPEDETSSKTQFQESFLKYLENEYSAKQQRVPVNKLRSILSCNLVPSATAFGSYQLSFDPYDLASDDKEYAAPNNVAETTPGPSNCAACSFTTARLCWNSPPEAPNNWWQINPNSNDYHPDAMQISSTFWLPDITDLCHQQEETHSNYTDLSTVASDILSMIPHGVGVETSVPLGQDLID